MGENGLQKSRKELLRNKITEEKENDKIKTIRGESRKNRREREQTMNTRTISN